MVVSICKQQIASSVLRGLEGRNRSFAWGMQSSMANKGE